MYCVNIYDPNGVLRFWVGGKTKGEAIEQARCKVAEHCLANPDEPPADKWHLGNVMRQ
jgi:hypothetical protein